MAERNTNRMRWLRFNREEQEFELKCTSCTQWLQLDPTNWDETRSLSTCRECLNARRRLQPEPIYPCGHPRIEVNTVRNKKGYGICKACQNERNRVWARKWREKMRAAA